jgi:Uma2 family endonuclease
MTAVVTDIEKSPQQKIPEVFIAEYLDGMPLYYKGYKAFIDTPEKAEAIMGAGGIHSILLSYFITFIVKHLNEKEYWLMTGETGLKLEKNIILNLDLAIYLKEKLPSQIISKSVVSVPPELVIEIDTSIEFDTLSQDEYVFKKIQRLLQFGTKKIVWVFSSTNMVMIAEPNAPWQIHPWHTTLPLMDGINFNIEAYYRENGLDNLLNP